MEVGIYTLAFAITILTVIYRAFHKRRLPPGPRGLPILGNVLDVPKAFEWLTYSKWGHVYGSDIIHLQVFGTHIIVLNSVKAVNDLLVKRSSIYSDRGESTMANLAGWQRNMLFARYGDHWKSRARVFQQAYNTSAMPKHRPKLLQTARTLLHNFLIEPEDFIEHIRYWSGSSILGVTFGINVQREGDPYVEAAREALECLTKVVNVGAYAVNFLPFLRHVPAWLPGMQFKRDAAEWHESVSAMFDGPYGYVERSLAVGDKNTSIVGSLLQEFDDDDQRTEKETVIRDAFGAAFVGGADSSYASLNTFILAMLKYPDVQRKAQEELDRVLGQRRLPDFDDRDSLPYITAIVKEMLRWILVTPLAAPHRLMVDDEYEGYHLPAGSIVVGNSWAVLHDEERYPDPDAFIPERFLTAEGKLNPDAPDPHEACFGYGRRMCPGRYFALDTLWIAVASLLAVFSIEKPIDESGKVVEPSMEYTSGTVCYPLPYRAVFRPRHESAEALIKAAALADNII